MIGLQILKKIFEKYFLFIYLFFQGERSSGPSTIKDLKSNPSPGDLDQHTVFLSCSGSGMKRMIADCQEGESGGVLR